MKTLNKQLFSQTETSPDKVVYYDQGAYPERVVQFGEGNFLRGFVDWMIHEMNKRGIFQGRVVAIQPTPHGKVVPKLNEQDGLYTLIQQGIDQGEQVEKYELISSISRGINPYENWEQVLELATAQDVEFVFSNTTEAGLVYEKEEYERDVSPVSFPGKLAAFLYERFQHFAGDLKKGLTIIPCELVEDNGDLLKELVLRKADDWKLPEEFKEWVDEANRFCNTLVDRIVPGYPADKSKDYEQILGYEDKLLVVGELYHLFVIDPGTDKKELLPFKEAGLNVEWADPATYRKLKVSLLNAPHTMIFSTGYLAGVDTVRELMEDEQLSQFVRKAIYEEINPLLSFPESEKNEFAETVMDRFRNPFIAHKLTDIGLNGISKFKSRVLPFMLDWQEKGNGAPMFMTFSLASLLSYFQPVHVENGTGAGERMGKHYPIRDREQTMERLEEAWKHHDGTAEASEQLVADILSDKEIWGRNLADLNGIKKRTSIHLHSILRNGMREALQTVLQEEKSKL
ncbi:tagaturonate reductase [Sediminibacillus massiliensis]|uniref:tagaturonate reductase n=1 Tax=Sediminibacillus massiliensis TaxID=1926277 RepID=UPI000988500B|nr:tagaturonate reductase [Sediminibacillus massiliensis]